MKITNRKNPVLVSFDSLCPGDVFVINTTDFIINNTNINTNNNLRIVGMKINKIVNGQNFIDLSTGYLCTCPLSETVELKRDVELIID